MPGLKLAVTVDGPPEAPVLVLANPIGTSMAIWRHQVPALSRHFRVLRFEHRGHGAPGAQSPAPAGPYSMVSKLITPSVWVLRVTSVRAAAFGR